MITNLRLYHRLVSVRIRAQMQYRISFIFDVLTTAFVSGISFLSFALVMQRFDGIAGWTLPEVTFLFGMVETGFGFMDMLFSGFDPPRFGYRVRFGNFDQMLLRPINITLQVFSSEFIIRRVGRIIQGLLILLLALYMLEMDWTALKFIYIPFVIISQVFFFGGLFIIGATVTFWTIESIEAINIFTYGGTEMMSYPMHIYPDWIIRFFTLIIPAIFLNYYPAIFILDKPDPFGLPTVASFLAPLAGMLIFGIGILFWQYGIRQYQSTGT